MIIKKNKCKAMQFDPHHHPQSLLFILFAPGHLVSVFFSFMLVFLAIDFAPHPDSVMDLMNAFCEVFLHYRTSLVQSRHLKTSQNQTNVE